MDFKERLRNFREDRDLTQKDIALQLGIKQHQYSRYETGANEMPLHYLVIICKTYGVSADYLLGLPKGLHWER